MLSVLCPGFMPMHFYLVLDCTWPVPGFPQHMDSRSIPLMYSAHVSKVRISICSLSFVPCPCTCISHLVQFHMQFVFCPVSMHMHVPLGAVCNWRICTCTLSVVLFPCMVQLVLCPVSMHMYLTWFSIHMACPWFSSGLTWC